MAQATSHPRHGRQTVWVPATSRRPAVARTVARARLAAAGTLAVLLLALAACSSPSPTSPGRLAVTLQPKDQAVQAGGSVTLSVSATGSGPFTYQWFVGPSGSTSSPIPGATTATYQTPKLTSTTQYWVRITDATGSVASETVTVVVVSPPAGAGPGESNPGTSDPPPDDPPAPGQPEPDPPAPTPETPAPTPEPPTITSQPEGATITAGQIATVRVQAAGTDPLAYQWYVGAPGVTVDPVRGATGASYTSPPLSTTTTYWVRVSNSAGSVDSIAATVTVTAPTSGSASFEDQVLALVNQRRAAGATCGGTAYPPVGPLTIDASLRAAARAHSEDMAAHDYFSHTSQDGRTFDRRMKDAGYGGSYPWGENIAAGQSSPQAVVNSWMGSTGHCANIMSGNYHVTGIGYAYSSGAHYGHYWTEDFGGS